MFATIGYEKAALDDFIETLRIGGVEVLVDIRDRAQSRRKGFSKTALSNAVQAAGMRYVHIKALGDPKEGREAARAGRMSEFRSIFTRVLNDEPAQLALHEVEELARANTICLMCYERDHHCCHRKIVADCLEKALGCKAMHLGVNANANRESRAGRMFHRSEGSTAQI
jgi:uncharacterized protein (DUF488 family)